MAEVLNISLSIQVDNDNEKAAVMQSVFNGTASQAVKRFALSNMYPDDLLSKTSNIEAYIYHLYNTLISMCNMMDSQCDDTKSILSKITSLNLALHSGAGLVPCAEDKPKQKPKTISSGDKKLPNAEPSKQSQPKVAIDTVVEPPKKKGLIFGRNRMKRS